MSKFATRDGREWTLILTVGDLRTCREAEGIDLGRAMKDEKALQEIIFADPEKLVTVLWLLVGDQAPEGYGPEQFARGFDGATIGTATEALLQSVADFFPRLAISQALKESYAKLLERMDAVVVAQIREATLKACAGNSQASRESATP